MNWWHRLNDRNTPLGRAWRTFYQAFLGIYLVTLIGWLNQVADWASTGAGEPFPYMGVLVTGAISAAASAAVAVITLIQNMFEDKRSTAGPME